MDCENGSVERDLEELNQSKLQQYNKQYIDMKRSKPAKYKEG